MTAPDPGLAPAGPHVAAAYRRLRALAATPQVLRPGERTDLVTVLDDYRDLRVRVAELLAEKEVGAWMS